ncbi:TonB-dependent receptor plug domain-containing protein [Thiocystis violacea]|uniref:TonB-dependent receptor plug domain-containing protein n=1 Tax=Thiocystis violacea TaxID=13725 RepID=UPI0019032AD5|nr:TonB-dependent receptor [Thiocystis violacea]MBK1716604.1 hypothetical protein [Thiocystis violacea]
MSARSPSSGARIPGLLLLTCLVAASTPSLADEILSTARLASLKGLDVQELLEVPVTSASRRPQRYADAAAALFVISREDIRRSGATSFPELLRMVPGVQVAQVDANKWAISARGFNSRYSSKLLVRMDGRTLYSPLYSGVYWDVQDALLDDIERIEVIRGPGATLWGANAVNGIINIISRSAHQTQGGLLALDVGKEEGLAGAIRHGGAMGEDGAVRLYAKGFERDASRTVTGEDAADDWRDGRVGFRSDLDLSESDSLTFQGDYYNANAGATITRGRVASETESDTSGGNLLARWTRQLGFDAGMEFKGYFDQTRRSSWTLDEIRDTLDLDFQQHFTLAERHLLVWGTGYRLTRDLLGTEAGAATTFDPERREDTTLSAFVQDDIALLDEALHLIVGTKLERNDYTGWELQPNLRLLWSTTPNTNLWAAVSRALRTSSRFESDVVIKAGRVLVSGNTELNSERLTAYELGLRTRPRANLSLDLSAFVNDYDHLVSYTQIGDSLNFTFDNEVFGTSHGLELASNWDVTRAWRLKLAYSWIHMDLQADAASSSIASPSIGDSAPRHQVSLRSWFNPRPDLELDANIYYVDALEYYDTGAYLRLDLRLGWRLSADLELSLVGKNLLDESHPEFSKFSGNSEPEGLVYTQVERSLMLQAKWEF